MSRMEKFLELVAVSRHDQPPMIDVSLRVMRQVRKESQAWALNASAPLAVFTGLSLSAAALVFVLALPAWRLEHSPFAALFEPFARLMQ